MKNTDKIKRAFAFYFSVGLFSVTLPILLSYSLGYKIDYLALKAYKTGIIYIKSHPAGASIYVNGKKYNDLTPAQIEELKPGTYRIEVRREGFYPWEKDLVVRPNMVTKADRIVLFPLVKEIKKVVMHEALEFVISNKNYIYYMSKSGLFRSGMDGSGLKRLSPYSNWPPRIIDNKFSPDGNKLAYFNESSVNVIYLNLDKALTGNNESAKVEEALTTTDPIIDIFWYSGSNYIIAVTEKDIKVVELRSAGPTNIVSLYKFNARPRSLYYDKDSDSLYFTDTLKESDSKDEGYFYRLDLRQKFFDSLMELLLKREVEEEGYEKR